jgi:glycerol-3-phosphate dehydrogenase (NAD(P)+)
LWRLAVPQGLELPIAAAVREVLHGDLAPADALSRLLARERKAEYPEGLFGS